MSHTVVPPVSWDELNERQRAYLQELYACDQMEEQDQRSAWTRGLRPRPADEWRWIFYGDTTFGPSAYKRALQREQLVDQGTGATFEALRARGLLLVRSHHDNLADSVHLRMTTAGRKLARAATGEVRPAKLPVGTLREWHWRALVLLYRAGALKGEGPGGRYYAIDDDKMEWRTGISWETLLRLLEYKWGALAVTSRVTYWESRYDITPFGRAYYERELARYQALYPDVLTS
jgi:hypothetical protein